MAKAHKLLAAGTATFIAEPALAFAHQGGLGIIVGLAVGAVAWGVADDIEQRTGRSLSLPASSARQNKRAAQEGKPNPANRLLVGKSQREAAPAPDEEAESDTVFVDENEGDDLLPLGWNLTPHVNTLFSKRVSILGMSGAGKSNLLARLVECLGKYDAPLILFDSKPEYRKLCSRRYLTSATRANATSVTPQNARAVAVTIMEERRQVVLDLSSYEDPATAVRVMIGLVLGVHSYQKARENTTLIPCTFVLEEAHEWLPENEAHSPIRGVKEVDGQSLLGQLQRCFFNLAKLGRSFGMGLITATQRPADIDKRLISQAEWRFMLKAMDPSDLKTYRTYGATDEQIISLDPMKGEAYVVGPDGSRGVYRIYRRESPDEAQSPGLANIRATERSPRSRSPEGGGFEQVNASENVHQVNTMNGVNGPAERVNSYGWTGERSQQPVNGVNTPAPMEEAEEGYTPDEEMQVVLAYAELRAAGSEPTRRAILAYLEEHHNWNRRHYTRIIKPVCDKRGLATSES